MLGIVGPVAFVSVWIGCGLATEGYSAVSDAISELAAVGASTRWIMTAGFVVFGTAVPLYGWLSLRAALPGRAWIALVVTGLATLGVAAVPLGRGTDTLHGAFASLGYVSLALAPALASIELRRRGRAAAATMSLLAAAGAGVCLLATLPGPAHGMFQRAGLAFGDAWIVATAVVLLRSGLLVDPQPSPEGRLAVPGVVIGCGRGRLSWRPPGMRAHRQDRGIGSPTVRRGGRRAARPRCRRRRPR